MNLNPYKIYKKHGIKGSLSVTNAMFKLYWEKKAWSFARFRFYKNLFNLMFNFRRRRKRLLGIWDWAALPWSVGDPMAFIKDLNILKVQKEYDVVDICVIFDLQYPEKSLRKTNLTSQNVQSYALDFLPLFNMCSGLGTVHLFNDRSDLYNFIEKNIDDYEVYPSLPDHLGQKFNYFGGSYWNVILPFYDKHKYLPPLEVSHREKSWAMIFFREHIDEDKVPVVISLKNTIHATDRNADLDLWYDFLKRCNKEKPEVQFIQVGLKGEADPKILELPNVIFSKDYATNLIQDVALVGSALMYMGSTSGIGIIPLFSDIPYIITNAELKEYSRIGIKTDENLPFATDQQKIFPMTKQWTSDMLFKEFCSIFNNIDKKSCLDKHTSSHKEIFEHPSTNINFKR